MSPESRITVMDIWQLALPAGTILLGGEEGLGQPWSGWPRCAPRFPCLARWTRATLPWRAWSWPAASTRTITPAHLLNELHRAQSGGTGGG